MASKIERSGSGWKILVHPSGNTKATPEPLTCDKLILALGTTSIPNVPVFNLGSFDGLSFHSVEMGRRHKELTADPVKHVTVVGGHKSALEVVGTCAQAGKKVEWLLRADGGGATWMVPAKKSDGSSWTKMFTTRAAGFLSTSVYRSDRRLNRFLYSGRWWLGTCIPTWVWGYITNTIQGDKYVKSENGRRLKPQPERYASILYLISIDSFSFGLLYPVTYASMWA